ncbi:MAG TPA: hypothetical protein VF483_13455, partial [Gemmatimonadaceae bacterium]
AGKTLAEPKAKTVPATRVARTPAAGAPTAQVAVPQKSKTGLYAGIGGGVVVLGVAAFFLLKGGSATGAAELKKPIDPASTTTAAPAGGSSTAPAAGPDMDTVLDSVEKLTDLKTGTAQSAATALQRLGQIAPASLTVDQQVRVGMLTAAANAIRDNQAAACSAIQGVKAQSRGTKYQSQVDDILKLAACP